MAEHPKEKQNISGGSGEQNETKVKFPKRLRYRNKGRVLATIYKGDHPTQPYTLYWRVRVDGKPRSRFKSFSTYSEAKRFAVETGAAVAYGCHFAKGNASAKEAIDRISGSGVFARDPDSLLIFTKHEEPDAFTVEPILRKNFPSPPPQERSLHGLTRAAGCFRAAGQRLFITCFARVIYFTIFGLHFP